MNSTRKYQVLYTHQKTKKCKTWQDGFLCISNNGTKGTLYDTARTKLDTLYLQQSLQVDVGCDLESDKYLITVEEEEKGSSANGAVTTLTSNSENCPRNAQGFQYHPAAGPRGGRFHGSANIPQQQQQQLPPSPPPVRRTGTLHGWNTLPLRRQGISRGRRDNNVLSSRQYDPAQSAFHAQVCREEVPTHIYQEDSNPRCMPSNSLFSTVSTTETDRIKYTDSSSDINEDGNHSGRDTGVSHWNQEDGDFNLDLVEYSEASPLIEPPSNFDSNVLVRQDQEDGSSSYDSQEQTMCCEISEEALPAGAYSVTARRSNSEILALFSKPAIKQRYEDANLPYDPSTRFRNECVPQHTGSWPSAEQENQEADRSQQWNWKGSVVSGTAKRNTSSGQVFPHNSLQYGEFQDNVDHYNKGPTLPSPACNPTYPTRPSWLQNSPDSNISLSLESFSPEVFRPSASNMSRDTDMRSEVSPYESGSSSRPLHKGTNSFNVPRMSSTNTGQLRPVSFLEKYEKRMSSQRGFQSPVGSLVVSGQLGDLHFPSSVDCHDSVVPTRQVCIPVTFDSINQYRNVLRSALKEHLNITLFELARNYHLAMAQVDVTEYLSSPLEVAGKSEGKQVPSCPHGSCKLRAVKKDGPNKGRLFYSCPGPGNNQCKFFKWADELQPVMKKENIGPSSGGKISKMKLSTAREITTYLESHNISAYFECIFLRKSIRQSNPPWKKRNSSTLDSGKKAIFLELLFKRGSSTYSKDDLWVVSKSPQFEPKETFVAKSVYYGPSSSLELEISPISGYFPSNWQSGESVFALLVCNAGSELTCLTNIEDHVKTFSNSIFSQILNRNSDVSNRACRVPRFISPLQQDNIGRNILPWDEMNSLDEEIIHKYHLNEDQAAALRSCARMFAVQSEDEILLSLTLIHGVFGAGKSYLLAVMIIFMMELFKQSQNRQSSSSYQPAWKILLSSTTNVAVDRILLCLLDLGFEEFVRVGSVRKIAKSVLPYSVHSTGSDSQELRELQSMLKEDLSRSEKLSVKRSIEKHKMGENRKRLGEVCVVGVTCAACVFPCMEKLQFPVVLLDECSQITEPASLLPVARFGCQKLVLVGDPKQLTPTIQGSEPGHSCGLEQTLFDRMVKMGYETVMLRTQYRCHPNISSISNRLFYNEQLKDGVTPEDRQPLVDVLPTVCFFNSSKGKEIRQSSYGSYSNVEEAKFVVFLISFLLHHDVEPSQIGVITLYKSQLHTISNLLTEQRSSTSDNIKGIQISTVDAFQGGEKDVIILSCVRTDHVGFIDCDRRTNVALSRAKRHLLIVGNMKMLSENTLWGKVIDCCSEFPNGVQSSVAFMGKHKQLLEEEAAATKPKNKTGKRKSSSAAPKDKRRKTCEDESNPSESLDAMAEESPLLAEEKPTGIMSNKSCSLLAQNGNKELPEASTNAEKDNTILLDNNADITKAEQSMVSETAFDQSLEDCGDFFDTADSLDFFDLEEKLQDCDNPGSSPCCVPTEVIPDEDGDGSPVGICVDLINDKDCCITREEKVVIEVPDSDRSSVMENVGISDASPISILSSQGATNLKEENVEVFQEEKGSEESQLVSSEEVQFLGELPNDKIEKEDNFDKYDEDQLDDSFEEMPSFDLDPGFW